MFFWPRYIGQKQHIELWHVTEANWNIIRKCVSIVRRNANDVIPVTRSCGQLVQWSTANLSPPLPFNSNAQWFAAPSLLDWYCTIPSQWSLWPWSLLAKTPPEFMLNFPRRDCIFFWIRTKTLPWSEVSFPYCLTRILMFSSLILFANYCRPQSSICNYQIQYKYKHQ